MSNDVNIASVQAFIEQLEIYVGEILIDLLDDELYCNHWPYDKLFNEISESPDNVDVKFKVVFIHIPFVKFGYLMQMKY